MSRRGAALLAAGLLVVTTGGALAEELPSLDLVRRLNEAFVGVAEKVSPAVVVIEVAHRPDYQDAEDMDNPLWDALPPDMRRRFREHLEKRREQGSPSRAPVYDGRGSGIVIRADGWVLTNDHVVEGAEKVRVKFRDGRSYEVAQGKWFSDPQSDIAVIKIEADQLTVATLADSSKTRVGEFAIAIGAPFDLDFSVTVGHVSAKGRTHVIPSWMGNSMGASMDQDFIQTDASINPGNSGGPLVNIDAEVIGVNTLIRGFNRGIGFAIPSSLAKQVADSLIANGRFARAWLGVQITALRDDTDLGELLPSVRDGVVVRRILPDGPASRSGLKPADVITAVDGAPVATAQQLRNEVRAKKIGSTVKLSVVRPVKDGKVETLELPLRTEEWPEETRLAARPASPSKAEVVSSTGLGLTVQTLTAALADKFGVEMTSGVVVTEVEQDSPASRQGFKTGEVITEVDRKPVGTAKEFRDAVKNATAKGLLVHLISEGAPEFRILKDGGD